MRIDVKKWIKEIAVMAVITVAAMIVIGYLRAPSYENAEIPSIDRVSVAGKPIALASYRGQPLVVHFWATWCPTCRAEAGNIDAVAENNPVVTVAVKSGSDADLMNYLNENDLHFEVVNDRDGTLSNAFKIGVFPTTIILDSDGKVFWSETGYTTSCGAETAVVAGRVVPGLKRLTCCFKPLKSARPLRRRAEGPADFELLRIGCEAGAAAGADDLKAIRIEIVERSVDRCSAIEHAEVAAINGWFVGAFPAFAHVFEFERFIAFGRRPGIVIGAGCEDCQR